MAESPGRSATCLHRRIFLCYQASMQKSFVRYWFYFSYPKPLAEGLTSI